MVFRRDKGLVYWDAIGEYSDIEEDETGVFGKVTGFVFDWDQYLRAIEKVPAV
jgi:hypothetical protein